MKSDIWRSLTVQSETQYKAHWSRFVGFTRTHLYKHYSQITSRDFSLYVAYLHNKPVKSSTIRSVVSAITFTYKSKGLSPPTDSFAVAKLLVAYAKTDKKQRVRNPLSAHLLYQLLKILPKVVADAYEVALLQALFTLMYAALLRICEVTHSKKSNHNLLTSNVYVESNAKGRHVRINMKSCKFSKGNLSPILVNQNQSRPLICPVIAFREYLRVRPISKFTFCHRDSTPLNPKFVRERLSLLLTNLGLNALHFNTHSFRIGKATDMYNQGCSDIKISKAGRWNSKAFLKYIKPNIISLA